jgi:hypothetical protein
MEGTGLGKASKAEDLLFGQTTSLPARLVGYIASIEAMCLQYQHNGGTGLVTGGLCFFRDRLRTTFEQEHHWTGFGFE